MERIATGGCMCGGVRYEVDLPLLYASYCHCTRCQRRTGAAASAQARVAPGAFRIVKGEALVKAYQPPGGFEKAFCTECGSALFGRDAEHPEVIAVRLGTFDEDPGVRPSYRQWMESAASWEAVPDDDGLRHFPGGGHPD